MESELHNVFEEKVAHSDEPPKKPYKRTLTWVEEGVRITVEAESSGLPGLSTAQTKLEADRRAKMIIDHFKILIPRAKES